MGLRVPRRRAITQEGDVCYRDRWGEPENWALNGRLGMNASLTISLFLKPPRAHVTLLVGVWGVDIAVWAIPATKVGKRYRWFPQILLTALQRIRVVVLCPQSFNLSRIIIGTNTGCA